MGVIKYVRMEGSHVAHAASLRGDVKAQFTYCMDLVTSRFSCEEAPTCFMCLAMMWYLEAHLERFMQEIRQSRDDGSSSV
jgi:hypothetical protein